MSDSHLTNDPYWRLRATPPTPDNEICHCPVLESVMLCDKLGDNPLYCVHCRGEVAPDRIGFDEQLAEDIAFWRALHRALYMLWLDSGEYESWATKKLSDPQTQVHRRGREIVAQLNQRISTYYWWLDDPNSDFASKKEVCPLCGGSLMSPADSQLKICAICRIIF